MLYLLERTNSDWWAVRVPSNKQVGYVPANYVRELPPESAELSEEQSKKSDVPDAGATTTPKATAQPKPAASRADSASDSAAKAARPSLPNTPRPLPVAAGPLLPLSHISLTVMQQLS